jgi:hypothetical protein
MAKTSDAVRKLSVGLPLCFLTRLEGEDLFSYRHDFYQEHQGRTEVQTDTFLVQKILAPWLDLRVEGVYDAISGATPIGAPAPNDITLRNPFTGETISGSGVRKFKRAGSTDAVSGASPSGGGVTVYSGSELPTSIATDYRRAITAAAGLSYGPHRLTPEFSYSEEHDYYSRAFALNYALDFNQKNTTLNAGWSHAWDNIVPNPNTFITQVESKDTDDFLLGVTQLLGPKTVFSFTAGYGYGTGYFNDPYRGVIFEATPIVGGDTLSIYEEKRPGHRSRETARVAVTQAVTPWHASVEGAYRYYHDSFDIHAHTVTLAWHQKVGSWLVISPSFRYYRQTAASFYATEFPGNPDIAPAQVPQYYSADYRLSALQTFAYGLDASVKVREWLSFEGSYQRYDMQGLDGVTSSAAYPTADVFTVGVTVRF